MMKKFRRLSTFLLALMLLLQTAPILAQQSEEETVTHIANNTVALKVRRSPNKNAGSSDSVPRGSFVYIIEYGDEWCRIRTDRTEGYVMTQYLTNLQAVGETVQLGTEEEAEEPAAAAEDAVAGFTMSASTFEGNYYASTARVECIYKEPSYSARRLKDLAIYEDLVVGEVAGDWALVCYKDRYYGYMPTSALFKWDYINPYAGKIPGLEYWPLLAFVNHSTVIYDKATNKPLQTINPGSAICVGEPDELGRYLVPYQRQDGFIWASDIAYLMPVVPYEEAQSGDLISVMTTYYAVGVTTLQFQGRNWNIRLASTYISGTVLQPGQEYNQNKTIGPYRKSTGYKSAPIMSDDAYAGYGGGTCQVNTTFYISTMQLPLLVKHRLVHANVGIYYAEKGFDAAVGGGDINLIMENTLPYAIRYQCFVSDGLLTVCIFRE